MLISFRPSRLPVARGMIEETPAGGESVHGDQKEAEIGLECILSLGIGERMIGKGDGSGGEIL
jgi:hypothetical protein